MRVDITKNVRLRNPLDDSEAQLVHEVCNRTFIKGQKVKVLVGCIWQKAEIEGYHSDNGWYLCGTRNWSTHFHESSIKAI